MALSWEQRQQCLWPVLQMSPVTGKAALRAAIDAVDDWLDANATAFNQAIPQPARSALTAAQKLELLYIVARKRFGG